MATVALVYFYQSSFAAAVGKTLLIFGYREPEEAILPASQRLSDEDLRGFNNIIVFAANSGAEQLDPAVFRLNAAYPITYILDSSCRGAAPDLANIRFVRKGEVLTVAGVFVTCCPSTGEGVSFLVRVSDVSIFYAGELNLWHWREESAPRDITEAEHAFYEAVKALPDLPVDIALFPLDPNLGGFYYAGANHYIMAKKPRVFVPMHFGQRGEIAKAYARKMHTRRTTVYAMTRPRETAMISIDGSSVEIEHIMREIRPEEPKEKTVALNVYLEDNPFSDTDLPVDLGGQTE